MDLDLFLNFDESEKNALIKRLSAKKIKYKKEGIVATNINNIDTIGIILSGKINIIRYDYNGKKTIVSTLKQNDIFGKNFNKSNNNELYAIARDDSEILFIEYDKIISSKNPTLISNLVNILANKVVLLNERIELLTKKTIREKILDYFSYLQSIKISKTFTLDMTFTDLADYLSVDRTALMRELKNLSDYGLIKKSGKRITILY